MTLFACAFPMSSFFTVIFIWVETRTDTYKIENLCRRPISFNTHDIGIWSKIVEIISYCAVVSNLFLFAFSSNQARIEGTEW